MTDFDMAESSVDELELQSELLKDRVRKLEDKVATLEERLAHVATKMTIWAAQRKIDERRAGPEVS